MQRRPNDGMAWHISITTRSTSITPQLLWGSTYHIINSIKFNQNSIWKSYRQLAAPRMQTELITANYESLSMAACSEATLYRVIHVSMYYNLEETVRYVLVRPYLARSSQQYLTANNDFTLKRPHTRTQPRTKLHNSNALSWSSLSSTSTTTSTSIHRS